MDHNLRRAWQFFRKHAGYCSPPGQAVCALHLARAERWAKEEGATTEWLWDDVPWDGDMGDYEPSEVLGCVLRLGEQAVSLWGIADPSPEYQRVVEAELASELQEAVFDTMAASVLSL